MEIMPGLHHIDGVNGNCYLVLGDEPMLVDTGMPGNARKILDYVKSAGKSPSDIKTIVLTHHHVDHVGNVFELKKATGATVASHRDDADYISGRKRQETPKGVSFLFKVMRLFMKAKPVQSDILLGDGNTIGGFQVVHAPGHTQGSICLYDAQRKVIFVGDTVRFMNGRIEGPPERFTADPGKARQSIEKISNLNFEVMLSGHGQPLRPNASYRVKDFYRAWKG